MGQSRGILLGGAKSTTCPALGSLARQQPRGLGEAVEEGRDGEGGYSLGWMESSLPRDCGRWRRLGEEVKPLGNPLSQAVGRRRHHRGSRAGQGQSFPTGCDWLLGLGSPAHPSFGLTSLSGVGGWQVVSEISQELPGVPLAFQ